MIRIAAGVVRRDGEVLLVKQQGHDDAEPCWALPGGIVEPDESLMAGLRREFREETGLRVSQVDGLLWAVEVQVDGDDFVHAFIYEVEVFEDRLAPDDPDEYIIEVRFVPITEAVRLIERTLPWRSMREPLLAYLRGLAPPGTNWFYRQTPDGDEILELAIPGIDPSGSTLRAETNGDSRAC